MSTSKETDPTDPTNHTEPTRSTPDSGPATPAAGAAPDAQTAGGATAANIDADGFVIEPAAAGEKPAPDAETEEPGSSTGGDTEDSVYDDPRRPLLRALKFGSVALLVVTIISLVAWGAAADLPGIWGVLIGAGIGGGFVLLTVVSMLATSRTDPVTTAVVVLVGWLIKIVVMILVLWILSGMTFYNTWALTVTIIVSLLIVLATETWGVVTSRVTYLS